MSAEEVEEYKKQHKGSDIIGEDSDELTDTESSKSEELEDKHSESDKVCDYGSLSYLLRIQ